MTPPVALGNGVAESAERVASPGDASDVTVTLVRGAVAAAMLRDDRFASEWHTLASSCPWATAYQRMPFVRAWLDVFGDRCEPVVLEGRTAAGALRGLLLLARIHGTGRIEHIGTFHAEYQTWLAVPADGDGFIIAAMRELSRHDLGSTLRLHFLAPGTPIGWTSAFEGVLAPRTFLSAHRRGLHNLDIAQVRASLRKRSNRSKLRRLGRHGAVQLLEITNADELDAWLPTIAAHCDARQGAINGVMPFRDEPRKADFYRALLRAPELAHAVMLVSGKELLACHIGVRDGNGGVMLGLISHAPHHGPNSPGKLLLLSLFERLAEQGFTHFDLTPGGAYKDRFATSVDEVFTLEICLTATSAARTSLSRTIRMVGKRLLGGRKEIAAPQLRQDLAVRHVVARREGEIDEALVRQCEALIEQAEAEGWTLRLNCVASLLEFGGQNIPRAELLRFLAAATPRLEHGATVCTVSRDRQMQLCAWLEPEATSDVTGALESPDLLDADAPIALARVSAVNISLEARDSSLRSNDLPSQAAIAALLLEVRRRYADTTVFMLRSNARSERVVRDLLEGRTARS